MVDGKVSTLREIFAPSSEKKTRYLDVIIAERRLF